MLICEALLGRIGKQARQQGTVLLLAFRSHYIIVSQAPTLYFSLSKFLDIRC